MTVELLTATFVWGGIGWLLDRWLGWEPWGLAVGFFLGFALGMYLLILRAQQHYQAEDARRARR